jgi:hypothetical protein
MNEDQMTLVCLVAWAITGALIGFLCGKARGQEAAGALLGALFGPLGWLVTFALADRRPKCAECGGVVIRNARRCRHCGAGLVVRLGPA